MDARDRTQYHSSPLGAKNENDVTPVAINVMLRQFWCRFGLTDKVDCEILGLAAQVYLFGLQDGSLYKPQKKKQIVSLLVDEFLLVIGFIL
jgi:hypothetical protein